MEPGHVLGQRAGLIEKQRKVLFESLSGDGVSDFLIGKGASEVDIKAVAEAAPEFVAAGLVERKLACRQQFDAVELLDRTLCFRVKTADRIDFVVEQLQPERQGQAHGPQVNDRPSGGELTWLPDLFGRLVARVLKKAAEFRQLQLLTGGQFQAVSE